MSDPGSSSPPDNETNQSPPDPPKPSAPSAGGPPTGGGGGGGGGIPWEDRDRIGWAEAFIETLKGLVTNPVSSFERMNRQGDFLSPLLFAVVVGWIGAIVNSIWGIALGSTIGRFLPSDMNHVGAMFAGSIGQLMLTIVFSPFLIAIVLFIWSGILHLCVLVTGIDAESDAGFEGTFRAVSYASVAQLAQVIPFFGGIIATIWGIGLTVIGLSRLHKTTEGRALLAVIIPVTLCCICVVGVGIVGMGALMAALANQ